MSTGTLKRRIWLVTAVVGAVTALAPMAQAGTGFQGSPDAIDRWLKARQAISGARFQGNPDAIDRWLKARRTTTGARLQGV